MLILIAESKSMHPGRMLSESQIILPQFESQAEAIVTHLRRMSAAELADTLKLGPKNAQRLYQEIYDFGNKATGIAAIEAFTGVVFRALGFDTLPADATALAGNCLGIVSSLYGLLRPHDIIKSYRLDFGMKAAPGNASLTSYWKPLLTEALIDRLQSAAQTEVLNLLPADAAKCFDWKAIAPHAQVYSVNFREYKDGGALRNPHSDRLKRLRGSLLRSILTQGITTVEALRTTPLPDMLFDPQQPFLTFIAPTD